MYKSTFPAQRRTPVVLEAVCLGLAVFLIACGGLEPRPQGTGGSAPQPSGGSPTDGSQVDAAGTGGSSGGSVASGGAGGTGTGGTSASGLIGAPLAFNPTDLGFSLDAVVAGLAPGQLRARLRAANTATWSDEAIPAQPAPDVAQWAFDGLAPGTRYDYEVLLPSDAGTTVLYSGSAMTRRQPGETFTFALITDSHIGADLDYVNQGNPATLSAVSAAVGTAAPDFILHLGDMLDFHEFGFNDPPPTSAVARAAYLNYRTLLGDTLGHAAHFAVIGNWEGENGTYSTEAIGRSMSQRWLYVPGPVPTTYPESGSPNQDYYAFTWGNALFIVLNVMTYTTTEHLLGTNPGQPDDWTLGPDQLAWLGTTLANATAKWRFLFIHHPVGGAAGNEIESGYGRGGGRAAYVGEQAKVHQLMRDHGAQIFFYGHDHVFTDMTVDGIHYTLPGSAGAPWTFSQSQTGYAQSWPDSGWGKVTVGPDRVDVQLISVDGTVLHAYTLPE